MVKKTLLALAGALSLAACNTATDYAALSYQITGNYSMLADCTYSRLSEESAIGLSHSESTAVRSAEIKSQAGGIVTYEAKFVGDGDKTNLTVRAMPTVYGQDFYPRKVRDAALSCAAPR